MTTAEATQEMAPPTQFTEPDPLYLELAKMPVYAALVAELGDPMELIDDTSPSRVLVDEFMEWCKTETDAYTAWVAAWSSGVDDEPGQHRAEETTE